MRNANVTITPKSYEVTAHSGADAIGVRFNIHQGYSNVLDSLTFPISGDDALALGAMLIAHSDHLAGRPVRNWS